PLFSHGSEEGLKRGTRFIQAFRVWQFGPPARIARHDMGVAAREDDDLSGFDRNWLPADDAAEAAPFRNHMIGNEMPRAGQQFRQDRPWRRLLRRPWPPGNDIEERRPGQAHGFQDI